MALKQTVEPKKSPEEIENQLKLINMKDGEHKDSTIPVTTMEKEVKLNYKLTKSEHVAYKMHCQLIDVDMQEKAAELVREWLKDRPKIGL